MIEVSFTAVDDHLEVRVSGELAVETVDQLEGLAESVSLGTSRVVLNLADLSFVDSTGVSALLRSVLALHGRGLPVSVENLREDLS